MTIQLDDQGRRVIPPVIHDIEMHRSGRSIIEVMAALGRSLGDLVDKYEETATAHCPGNRVHTLIAVSRIEVSGEVVSAHVEIGPRGVGEYVLNGTGLGGDTVLLSIEEGAPP